MEPSVTSSKRLSILSRVDFPAPDAPITPIIIGLETSKDALSTAVLFPKTFVTLSSLSTFTPKDAFAG